VRTRSAAPRPAAATAVSGPKMEIRGVSKRFVSRRGEVDALATCDVAIAKGEFVTVVGPSGCGKSTLMMIAAGLEEPTTGDVLVDGTPAGPAGPRRSVVFQKFALFPSETVAQNIEFGLRVTGVARAERESRLREQLAIMGLEQFTHAYPHELSGGMQQRVAIARALVVRPEILLMDEPFGALDAQTRSVMQDELLRIWARFRKTVIFVTHSISEALLLADTVLLMSARPGRVKSVLRVELARPRDEAAPRMIELRRRLLAELSEEIARSMQQENEDASLA